jgi:hypothetical protein
MSSAKPLREFEQMDWVPIDSGEIFDKRRPFPNQKGMVKAVEMDFLPEKHVEQPYNLETTGEVLQKLLVKKKWIRTMWPKQKGLWESSPRHHHLLALLKFMP